jgi:anti-sigma factor RsiW
VTNLRGAAHVTCREFADFIMDYTSGELPADVGTRFEEHLHICPNCLAYLASYQATVRLGRRAFDCDDEPVPPTVPEELVKAILAARDTN